MDETPTPLAEYPAPSENPNRIGSMANGGRGLFLLFGVMIGAAVVLLTIHFSEEPRQSAFRNLPKFPGTSGAAESMLNRQTQSTPPKDGPAAGATPANPNPNNQAAPTKPDQGTKPGPASTSAKPPPGQKPPSDSQPYNPFDGGAAMPPKEISGQIDGGSGVRLPAVTPNGETQVQPEPPKALLVTVRLDVADPAKAIKALEAIAAHEGGSAIQFDESAMKPDPEGVVMFVPAAKEGDAESQVGKIGSLVVSDKWSGATSDRLDRIERTANDRLSELHIQRQELLVKYFEDAPQIKHIDEDSDRITKCLDALRAKKQTAATAIIKIRFLG